MTANFAELDEWKNVLMTWMTPAAPTRIPAIQPDTAGERTKPGCHKAPTALMTAMNDAMCEAMFFWTIRLH